MLAGALVSIQVDGMEPDLYRAPASLPKIWRHKGLSKNRGPKMDGLFQGKPY